MLFVVTCAAILGAVALFPGDGQVAPGGAVLRTVDIVGSFVPSAIIVRLSNQQAPEGTLIDVALYSRQPHSSHAHVLLEYSRDTQGSQLCGTCVRLGGSIEDVVSMSDVGLVNARPFKGYGQVAETLLRGVPYNLASNSVYAAATLPEVHYVRSTSGQVIRTSAQVIAASGALVPVETQIALHSARSTQYVWSGSPTPASIGRDIAWTFFSPISGTAVSPSGVSLSGQDRDTKATFVAGALLGIAGGALVGALQEAIGAARRRRE